MKFRPTHNKDLPFIIDGWKGNPKDKQDRYVNLNGRSEKGYSDIFAWKMKGNEFNKIKKNQKTNVKVNKNNDFVFDNKNGFTWLGHASFFLTINRTNIIIDPVLFSIGPLKRFTDFPCDKEDLKGIDIILLSHNHRDHLDKKSMKLICKQNPDALIFTGLEIGKKLKSWEVKNTIVEAGWYQSYPEINEIKIEFLPTKHWCRRGLADLNEMLWGSFMIQTKNLTIYFGGDSGIDDHFSEIGELYPNIDYSMIGIGAYEPNWFMKPSHTNPQEALQAMKLLSSKKLIPMHYGTFDLSDEPIWMPKMTLLEEASQSEIKKIILEDIGTKVFV